MYNYEIIIEQEKVKSNDLKQIIKILKWLIDKGYIVMFKSYRDNISTTIEDDYDISMLEDNMEV